MPTPERLRPLILITHSMGLGGAELSLLRILRQCREWGVPVGFVSGVEGELLNTFQEAAKVSAVTAMPYPRKPKTWIHLPRFICDSRKVINAVSLDPCNLLSGDFYSLWATLKVKRPGDRVLSLWQGEYQFDDVSCVRKWLKYKAGEADRLLASSPIATHANQSGLLPHPVQVLNPAMEVENLDPAKHDPQSLRREFGWNDQRRLALCFGRIGWGKQQIPLAQAFLANPTLRQNWRLIIAGPASQEDAETLQTLCRTAPQSLIYVGPRNDIPRYLAGVDLVLQPSILGESFGMATIETLLMERPLLCFPAGSSVHMLGKDFPGFVRPQSLDALVNRWSDLSESSLSKLANTAAALRPCLLEQVGKKAWQKQLLAALS